MSDSTAQGTAVLEAPKQTTLTGTDRCDGCGAQAYVHVTYPVGDIYLCGHHFTVSEERIRAKAINVVDERWSIGAGRLDVSA